MNEIPQAAVDDAITGFYDDASNGLHARMRAALKAAAPHLTNEAVRSAVAAEHSRLFVAIRHGIGLDVPWRGEALDLIASIIRQDQA